VSQEFGKKCKKESLLLVLKQQDSKEKLLIGPNPKALRAPSLNKLEKGHFLLVGVLLKNLYLTKLNKI
jgi:hypothetical protein